MTKGRRKRTLALLIGLTLAGCKANAPDNGAAPNASEATPAPPETTAPPPSDTAGRSGDLIPPAPGEPGGLPDDRAPLDEKAARDPTSVPASGATLERWGIALAQGRYGDAYRLWQDGGAKSGLSEAAFADAYRKYSEIHVLVGRPVDAGPGRAQAPVQMYGRLKASGEPFNLLGMMTLLRNAGARAGDPDWLIAASDLKARGKVHVATPQAEATPAAIIPAAFQGQWARTPAGCDRSGDDSKLTIEAGALLFYESMGTVRTVERIGPQEIRVSASYSGEGETWSRDSRLKLSEDGKALTVDGTRRQRCAS